MTYDAQGRGRQVLGRSVNMLVGRLPGEDVAWLVGIWVVWKGAGWVCVCA